MSIARGYTLFKSRQRMPNVEVTMLATPRTSGETKDTDEQLALVSVCYRVVPPLFVVLSINHAYPTS